MWPLVEADVDQCLVEDGRSDSELVAAVNAGDSAAFEALYHRYRDWVVNLAYRFTADREAALDVLQETFLYFSRKFPGFRLSAKLTTFLYPAVRNYSIAVLRKQRRFEAADLKTIENEPSPPPHLQGEEGDLATGLAELPEEQRETLLLRFVDGMSLEEIAFAMKVPLGTVKSRLHYALKTLRESDSAKKYFLP